MDVNGWLVVKDVLVLGHLFIHIDSKFNQYMDR